ncbi:hypothetical protein NFJ02_14g16280 [Pycnococcus provasolii]
MAFASPLGPPALPLPPASKVDDLFEPQQSSELALTKAFAFVPLARCKPGYCVEAREFPQRHNAHATTYMSYSGLRHGHRGGPARNLSKKLPRTEPGPGAALPPHVPPDVPLLTLELACEALARRLDGSLADMVAPLPSHLADATAEDDETTAPRASFLARLRGGPRRGYATLWRQPGPPLFYRPDASEADAERTASVRVRCALDAEDVFQQSIHESLTSSNLSAPFSPERKLYKTRTAAPFSPECKLYKMKTRTAA